MLKVIFRRSITAIALVEGIMRLSRNLYNTRAAEKLTIYVVYKTQRIQISITSADSIEHLKEIVSEQLEINMEQFDLVLNG